MNPTGTPGRIPGLTPREFLHSLENLAQVDRIEAMLCYIIEQQEPPPPGPAASRVGVSRPYRRGVFRSGFAARFDAEIKKVGDSFSYDGDDNYGAMRATAVSRGFLVSILRSRENRNVRIVTAVQTCTPMRYYQGSRAAASPSPAPSAASTSN